MNTIELRQQIRRLRAVRAGEIFESHDVRAVLADARRLEFRMTKMAVALIAAREAAQRAFIEGWPQGHPWDT